MTQIVGFDFTIKGDETTQDGIVKVLKEYAKKWVFQLEKSDTGYVHWQGRMRVIKKRRVVEMAKILKDACDYVWHLSPTSNNAMGDFSYVMKADTRLEGPWKDDDQERTLTRQLKEFMELDMYDWQKSLLDMVQQVDDRTIKVIIEKTGNNGKSIMAEYLEYKGLAYDLPPFTAMEDLMQCAMGIPPQKCYLVDMPRGMKKEKLASFYAGLEALKNGVMYDKRYAFKKRRIDRPQIVVFTNQKPDVELLSIDRWVFYEITDKVLTQS